MMRYDTIVELVKEIYGGLYGSFELTN